MTMLSSSLAPAFRLSVLATAFVASFGAQAATLADLVTQARGYDAAFAAAQKKLEVSQAQAEMAQAPLRPSVGLATTVSKSRVEEFANPVQATSKSLALEATQSLFDRSSKTVASQAQLKIEMARVQLAQAEQDLMVRVAQAYFDLLGAKAQLSTVTAAKKAVQVQLERAQRNFEVGVATVTDTREAQAQFDRIAASEIAAQNDVKVKQLAIDQLVGQSDVKVDDLKADAGLPALAPSDVTVWIAQAMSNNPQVKLAQIGRQSAGLSVNKAEAGHLPTVSASYLHSRPFGATCLPSGTGCTVNKVSLTMKLPIFAGYAVQNQIKEAVATADQAQDELNQAKRNVAQGVRAAYFGVLSGRAQVKALQAAVASSQSALEANQTGYSVGVRINADVLSAQSQLYQTQSDLAKARYNIVLGDLKLRQAAGTLGQADLEALKGLYR